MQESARLNLRDALAGEINAFMQAFQKPTNHAYAAWEKKGKMVSYGFYVPRAVVDGNVGRLGELRDAQVIRTVSFMCSSAEMAREEGKRLDAGAADDEAMDRYVSYLLHAYVLSLRLTAIDLSSKRERLPPGAEAELDRLSEMQEAMMARIVNRSYLPPMP